MHKHSKIKISGQRYIYPRHMHTERSAHRRTCLRVKINANCWFTPYVVADVLLWKKREKKGLLTTTVIIQHIPDEEEERVTAKKKNRTGGWGEEGVGWGECSLGQTN